METVNVSLTNKEVVILTNSLMAYLMDLKGMDCDECHFMNCNIKKEYTASVNTLLNNLMKMNGRGI